MNVLAMGYNMDENFKNFLSDIEEAIGMMVSSPGILKLMEVYRKETERVKQETIQQINQGKNI